MANIIVLPLFDYGHGPMPLYQKLLLLSVVIFVLAIICHILSQVLLTDKNEPPVVFSWFPIAGSTVEYGVDPYKFFFKYRQKYGNIFTFTLIGRKHTVCLGSEGNNFVLGGKLSELSAADVYRDLTVPTFGKDVCYDGPPEKLMEQKRVQTSIFFMSTGQGVTSDLTDKIQFLKFGLTTEKLHGYVPIFLAELYKFFNSSPTFRGPQGTMDVVSTIGVMSIFTATRSLQGREVREHFSAELADLYHDLDMSFIPINFFFPGLPLPVNRRRDRAQQKIVNIYKSIITKRRAMLAAGHGGGEDDMLWNLMRSVYKDGTPMPDHEIAHMLIGMLMAGQHTSSSIGAWVLLRLASRPDIQEELYKEQLRIFGPELRTPTHDGIGKLHLHRMVVRETLRLHAPIHSIMRKVKKPLIFTSEVPNAGTEKSYVVPAGRIVISSPGVTAQSEEFFPNPEVWDPHRWENMPDYLDGTIKTDELGYGPLSKSAATSFLPFGAGRHRCVGEHFAYLQLGTITATVVREFKLSYPGGASGDEMVPKTDYESMFTRPVVPSIIEWEKREGGKTIA